jgi:hypothetical protein
LASINDFPFQEHVKEKADQRAHEGQNKCKIHR